MSFNKKYFLLIAVCFMITLPIFSQAMYLEINLNKDNSNPFAESKPSLDIFRLMEKAAADKKINGLILNIGSNPGERNYLWELRTAVEKFKTSGKKVCAFISNADMDIYCLASVADKIVIDELGSLNLLGYSVNRGFVKNTLEKLGVGVRELRYFEYKSASETYSRDSMSEADRRQYNDYLDDIFNVTRDTLIKSRNWTTEEFDSILNEFMYSATSAKENNLVDYIGRKGAVLEAIKEMEGTAVNNFILYGENSSSLTRTLSTYSPVIKNRVFMPPIIAIVNAIGQTDMERGMTALSLSKTIYELADKRRVKAIVIRIDSPGGSAEAADYIAEAVRYAKKKKPVVISMGQVAASGGYWAAMDASYIYAAPYTITGSIGVIGSWFYDNGLNNKLGLNVDSLKRGVHADLNTGFLLPYRDLTAQEEERYKKYIIDLYNVFTQKAAAGRGMDIQDIEKSAQGRIFSGLRAHKAGLIDGIGGYYDAFLKAKALADIPEKKKVKLEEYPKPKFFDKLLGKFPFASFFIKHQTKLMFMDYSDIRYRIENNGKIMPILPLEFTIK